MTSSGTEAAMSAIRLARAATGRETLIKFAGAYHGHVDGLLAEAGSGLATQGIPACPGVPEAARARPWSCPGTTPRRCARPAPRTSSPRCSPSRYPANMGLVPPAPGFLELLRELATEHGALLVFDEVITGFRVAPRRRAGADRHRARPHGHGQGHRRRPARGGLRRLRAS